MAARRTGKDPASDVVPARPTSRPALHDDGDSAGVQENLAAILFPSNKTGDGAIARRRSSRDAWVHQQIAAAQKTPTKTGADIIATKTRARAGLAAFSLQQILLLVADVIFYVAQD